MDVIESRKDSRDKRGKKIAIKPNIHSISPQLPPRFISPNPVLNTNLNQVKYNERIASVIQDRGKMNSERTQNYLEKHQRQKEQMMKEISNMHHPQYIIKNKKKVNRIKKRIIENHETGEISQK